jgi:hypothetical protein
MRAVGSALRIADVHAIYLVHGTFLGGDAISLFRELSRVWPKAAELARGITKHALDKVARDAGNYTKEYAAEFQSAINAGSERKIPVKLFFWTSENHHLGRADGAVRLIHELAQHEAYRGGRVLFWGHSHAGNVFALITNLLAAGRAERRRFFHAARAYYRLPIFRINDLPVWRETRVILGTEQLKRDISLDLVTFGTPIRYGWDCDGYAKLLHFVNHRPPSDDDQDAPLFPPTVEDMLSAKRGDYIQHLGIAGTNFAPSVFNWRSWISDLRLNRLLQAGIRKRDLLERLRSVTRVAEDGLTLLVDYGEPEGHIAQHLAGHAVYTKLDWLVFHAEEVARRFYGYTNPA